MTLRSAWLGVAHRPGDATLKSPRAGDVAQVACGSKVRFGYERDIDVALLEQRERLRPGAVGMEFRPCSVPQRAGRPRMPDPLRGRPMGSDGTSDRRTCRCLF